MGIKVIANTVLEDSVQVAVSNSSTTSYSATDALNVTGGARHIKASTDVAERAIIYRNNDKKLKADCCVLAGASRSFGHALGIKHFSDCDGTYGGGTGQTLQPWDANDFGRSYARDFDGTSQHASITDAAQTGLGFTGDCWFAGWINADVAASGFLAKNGGGSDNGYFAEINTAGSPHLRFGVSSDGTAQTIVVHPDTLSVDTYYFLFMYHDNGTGIGASINAGAMATAVHTGGLFNSSQGFYLARHPAAGQYFNGSMALWCCGTDLGRGPAEMASWLYNGGSGRAWGDWTAAIKARFGLVSHWSCDENSGNIIDDYGSNHLTDNNSVGVAAGVLASPLAIANRFDSEVSNPNETDAAQFNTTEIVGPRVRGEEPQDLVYFFPSRSAAFVSANAEYLNRANADITGLNNGDEDFTWCGWVNQTNYSGGTIYGFVSMGNGGTTDRRFLVMLQGGIIYFQIYNTSGSSKYVNTSTVSLDTWYHVCATYNATTKGMELYLDGVLVDSDTHTGSLNTCSTGYRLGYYPGSKYGWCKMRNVSQFDRIITSDELAFLYNNGTGRDWDELIEYEGLQDSVGSWWPLNEASGGRGDRGKWANHLSDNNTVTYDDAPTTRTGGGLIAGAEGFGVFLGAGSGSAYDEELTAAYFGESLDLGVATWPVSERPMASSVSIGEKNYKVERSAVLTFENLNREQLKKFEEIDLDAPVFLYDSEAAFLHDKLWHCLITDYRITPEFDDLSALTISINRLQHYPVAS